MIQISNICKSYGPLQILKNISLEIPDHEVLAIEGPSGAGKTTLLQIVGTLDLADSGSIRYGSHIVTDMKDRELSRFRNRNIGFVFQFHQLLNEFSAQENAALPAIIGGTNRRTAMNRAAELLDLLGLKERLRHKPGQLSGGEKQRVAFARALVNEPMVVFADEPTGSLDSVNRDLIRSLITDLRDRFGTTFVIVTHDHFMAQAADRIVKMADGRITEIVAREEETTDETC